MKKTDLALHFADNVHLPPAEAADQLDVVIQALLRRLKQGKQVRLHGPGLNPTKEPHGKKESTQKKKH
jgi:nucleoid DNA-binding protein